MFLDEVSDRSIIYYVTEISGNERIKYVPFGFYYYYIYNNNDKIDCYNRHLRYDEYKVRTLTPLKKFASLNDKPEPVANYIVPDWIWKRFETRINTGYIYKI